MISFWIVGLFAILRVAVMRLGCFGNFVDCIDASTCHHRCFDETHGGKVVLVEFSDKKKKGVVGIFRSGNF